MTSSDQVTTELHRLVEQLKLQRDRGLAGAPLNEQKRFREGFTAAMRLVASSGILVAMLDDESVEALG